VGAFEVLLGEGDLVGVKTFQTSFFPLFVQITESLPDLAVAPALGHLLPGAIEVAFTTGGEMRRNPMRDARKAADSRVIHSIFEARKGLHPVMAADKKEPQL
jgi:hypothetical protein